MKAIQYTQAKGFEDIDARMDDIELSTDVESWEYDEALMAWLVKHGFFPNPRLAHGEPAQCAMTVHQAAPNSNHEWHALVFLDNVEDFEVILVKTRADLLALRIALAPLVTMDTVEDIMLAAERAFHAWHGHSSRVPCEDCDPVMTSELEAQRLENERRQGQREPADNKDRN